MNVRPARVAISAAFFVQGLLFISMTLRLPEVQDLFDVSELALSGLMLMLVLLAGVGSVLAETLAKRIDSARTLRLALGVIALAFVVLRLGARGGGACSRSTLPGLALYGVGLGANDAASNMQAVAVEHRIGRPVMPSFHAAWTAGGLLATALAFTPMSLSTTVLVLVLAPLATLAAPLLRRDVPTVASPSTTELGVPWSRILLVGVALILFYMVDTSATAWGPVYLSSDERLRQPADEQLDVCAGDPPLPRGHPARPPLR